MAAVHKIIGDYYEDPFTLVALHSSMEDFAMVYALNQHMKSKFKRRSKDLLLDDTISFPIFEWRDDINDRYWALIANKSIEEHSTGQDLFKDETTITKHHLIPEHTNVDYFLKMEEDGTNEKIIKSFFDIPHIITAYILEPDKLKSRNNLIF